jgi:NADH-quinone oxidoreductase subunit L
MFIIGLTIGKGNQRSSSLVISSVALIMSAGVLWERIIVANDDYSFSMDWIVIGDTIYRIGYELNNSSAWLLMLIASLNILLLLLLHNRQAEQLNYGDIGLLLFAFSGLILADHMFLFFTCAILCSCSVYLLLAHPIYGSMPKAVFRFITAQLLGFSMFFIALVGLYWYMPDHALQFTMLETVFSGSTPSFTPFMKNSIAAALVASALLIAGVLPYANWIKHVGQDRPILRVVVFCFANALLPTVILLRFGIIIGEVNDVLWLCKFAGAIIVIWCTVRMLLNANQTLAYIGMMLLGTIVFAFGNGAYGYMLLQLTIICLSLIVIYGAGTYASSIIGYGSYLIAILTLIGVPPLSGYWLQQSLIATIAERSVGWYITALLIVSCSSLGTTIIFASQWKNGMKHAAKWSVSIVVFPAMALIALGLLWLVNHDTLEQWLFNEMTTESMKILPMLLTMLSIISGVAIAWLFSERITATFASTLKQADDQLRKSAERVGLLLAKLWEDIVKIEQLVERSLVQLFAVWLPYPFRIISRIGAGGSIWRSVMLVVIFTIAATLIWYGIGGNDIG